MRIVLTHAHGDHIGSLDALAEQLGRVVDAPLPEMDAAIARGAG